MRQLLTRRVRFAAAHRYRVPSWSDEQNERVFGLCARPSFHGHSYVCDVTVGGELDEITAMIVDLVDLDRILHREVVQRFDHRNINLDVPEFAEGRTVPTGEALAAFIFDKLEDALESEFADRVYLHRVTVIEDETLSATVER